MMVNRETAVELLHRLAGEGLLDEGLCDSLDEIANCIDAERVGFHLWNADDDSGELFIARRQDLWTAEKIEEVKKIADKYRFTPAPYEAEEFKEDEE